MLGLLERDHDEGSESGPERRDGGKQECQHVSDKHQLKHHPNSRNGELSFKLELERKRESAIHDNKECREDKITVSQLDVGHG